MSWDSHRQYNLTRYSSHRSNITQISRHQTISNIIGHHILKAKMNTFHHGIRTYELIIPFTSFINGTIIANALHHSVIVIYCIRFNTMYEIKFTKSFKFHYITFFILYTICIVTHIGMQKKSTSSYR